MNPALDSMTDGLPHEEYGHPVMEDELPVVLVPLPYHNNRTIHLDASREGAEILSALYTRMAQKLDQAGLMQVSIDQPADWPKVVAVANEELASSFEHYHMLGNRLKYKRKTVIGFEALNDLTVRCIFPEKN